VVNTGLSNTLGLVAPELAGVSAVALTVEATVDFITLLTFALRVGAQGRGLALAGAVADTTEFALRIWVGIVAEVDTFTD